AFTRVAAARPHRSAATRVKARRGRPIAGGPAPPATERSRRRNDPWRSRLRRRRSGAEGVAIQGAAMKNSTIFAVGFAAFCAAVGWVMVADEAQSTEPPPRPAVQRATEPPHAKR